MGTKAEESKVNDLMWALRRFTRTTLALQSKIANSIGLQATEAECIDYLQEMGPSTAGALAKATHLTTGAMTNVIDRLEKAGFVKRSQDLADRRKVIVNFIPEKHKPSHQHYGNLAADIKALFDTYTASELELLVKHTQRLDQIYQQNILRVEESKIK